MKSFWIKERRNPQLGVYYVGEGQMSKARARKHEETIYGINVMHEFLTEAEYVARLSELRNQGKKVH